MTDFKVRAILEADDRTGPGFKSAEQNIAELRGEFADLNTRLKDVSAASEQTAAKVEASAQKTSSAWSRAANTITRRLLSIGVAIKAFRAAQEELGAQSAQVAGAFETISSTINRVLALLGGALIGTIAVVADKVSQLAEAFVVLARTITSSLAGLPFVGEFFQDLTTTLDNARLGIDSFQATVGTFTEDLGNAMRTLAGSLIGANEQTQALVETAESAGPIITVYRDRLSEVGDAAVDAANGSALAAGQFGVVSSTSAAATGALARTREEARVTALQFDALAESLGRVAAVQAALAGGGTLSSNGRRIRLAGGGSRLTSEPGLSSQSRGSRFAAGQSSLI